MKVLFVLNDPDGGATQGVLELCRGWGDRGVEAYAVTPSAPVGTREQDFGAAFADYRVVPMGWWNRKVSLPAWYRPLAWLAQTVRSRGHALPVLRIRRLIKEWEIDVVYTNTSLIIDGAVAARLARRPHVWHVKEWFGNRARTKFPLPDRLTVALMSSLSDRVIAMSAFIAEPFVRHGADRNLSVIPDGVNVDQFRRPTVANTLRDEMGLAEREVLIAMVASLRSTWKRHDLFLDVAHELSDHHPYARFAIFGSLPSKTGKAVYDRTHRYAEGLRQRITDVGLADRFAFGVFWSDISEMMAAIDVLVHPCEIEPFGRIAIEAMAAGTPVVGPAAGGIGETIEDQKTGLLVPPGDAGALASAVAKLIENPSLRTDLGEMGRERASSQYDLPSHVEAVLRVCKDVVRT